MFKTELSKNLREIITPSNLSEVLRNYHSHLALSSHPLANLPSVLQQASKLEEQQQERKLNHPKGAALAVELKKLITTLEPADQHLPNSHSNRLPYEVMAQTVIQGRNATEVATRLFMSRSQLYRIREKALNDLCQLWIEQEENLLKAPEPAPAAQKPQQLTEVTEPDKGTTPEFSSSLRMVTILNANLSGLNKALAEFDPEEAHALLNHLFLSLSKAVSAQQGYVMQWYERGVCVLFGAPTNHEDDAVRAVRCALAMQTALLESQQYWHGTPLQKWPELRIAISTGRVFAGTLGTQGYNVTGIALQLAKALTERVPGGWILLEQQTYKMVRGLFQIESLEAMLLDEEIAQAPVPVYRVLEMRQQGELIGVRGVQGVETEMVGRSLEWGIFTRLYQECLELNSVRQLTIVGGGGIGKSRLEYEFRQYIELQPHQSHYWRGYANPTNRQPYQPFARMLNNAAGINMEDSTEIRRLKLLKICQQYFSESGQLTRLNRAEEVAHLLSVILEISWPSSPVLAILEGQPGAAQLYTFKAFADLCAALATTAPLIIILGDIHWAEETSLSLWNYLCSELAEAPIMLVGFARPELYERKPEWGVGLDRHFRLDLKPLTPNRSRELIHHILRHLSQLSEIMVEQIVEAAEGNPFYIEEIIKMLLEEGYLAIDTRTNYWNLARPLPETIPTPPTLEALVQARLDRLPSPEKVALELASIVGHNFSAQMLAALLPAKSQTDEKEMEEKLTRLQQRELVVKKPDSTTPTVFKFKHSLVREVLYEGLPRKRRIELHLLMAENLENERTSHQKTQRGFASVAMLAEQFERAGNNDKAIQYFEEAAEAALLVFAYSEAANYYQRILSKAELKTQPNIYARIQVRLARLEFLKADYSQAPSRLAQALPHLSPDTPEWLEAKLLRAEINKEQGQYEQGIEECWSGLQGLESSPLSAALLQVELGSLLFRQSRYDEAEKVLHEAYQSLRQYEANGKARELRPLANCTKNLSLVAWARGDLAEAVSYLWKSLPIFEQLNDQQGQATCNDTLGLIYRDWGELALSEEYYLKAQSLYQRIGDMQRTILTYVNISVLHWYRGELERAEELIRTAQKTYQEIGGRFGLGLCNNGLAQIYRDRGNLEAAISFVQQGVELTLAMEDNRMAAYCYNNLAKFSLALGELTDAHRYAQIALEFRQKIGHKYGLADSFILLGWLALEEGQNPQEHFENGYNLCEVIEHRFGMAQSGIGLGAAALQQGKYAEAREFLVQAYKLSKSKSFLEPQLQSALWLGKLAAQQGNVAEATAYFNQVIELSGTFYPFYVEEAQDRLNHIRAETCKIA